MQDYHIYTHYVEKQNVSKTSPKFVQIESKTKAVPTAQKGKVAGSSLGGVRKGIAIGLSTAIKINAYVGEFTENTVSASRRQVALSYAGMAAFAFTNPALALGAAAAFTANKVINYSIKNNKENLSADFMRQLSGGTVSTGR